MITNLLKKTDTLIKEFKDELFHQNINEENLQKILDFNRFSVNYQDEKGNSFLHLCITKEKLRSAQWLIDNGADLELKNKNQTNALILLIESDNESLLKYILDKKLIDINKQDQYGRTLLQDAVVLGHNEVAKLLIDKGADYNLLDKNGRNVLFDALSFGDKKFIKYLLDFKELDVNVIDNNQDSIMHHSEIKKDDENAIALLNAGADATLKNKEGETYLCNTALRGVEAEHVLQTAIEKGNDINSRVNNNNSILMEVVLATSKLTSKEKERRESLLKISKVLVDKGIEVNAVDDFNETALFRAVRELDIEQVSFLLSSGIDPNIINKNCETALSIAVLQGITALDIILLLLRYNADPTIKNHKDQTLYEVLNNLVLHTHNKKYLDDEMLLDKINHDGQYFVILKEILINYKTPLDFFDTNGDPIFFTPMLEDHFTMFKLYLTNGANIQDKNHDGYNLFYRYVYKVFQEDNHDIDLQNNLSLLRSKKVDHNSQDNTGYTVLHRIMHTKCDIHLFDTLIDVILFDYSITDSLGRSVVHAAVWNDQKDILKRIFQKNKEAINIPDIYGILPITYAALLGNQDLVILFLELRSNIKSNVKIAPQAIEKFRPMLKNLAKLKYGISDPIAQSHINILVEQIELDFSGKEQTVYTN